MTDRDEEAGTTTPPRHYCTSCGGRFPSPGECPTCPSEPLLDLASEEIRFQLAKTDREEQERRALRQMVLAGLIGAVLCVAGLVALAWAYAPPSDAPDPFGASKTSGSPRGAAYLVGGAATLAAFGVYWLLGRLFPAPRRAPRLSEREILAWVGSAGLADQGEARPSLLPAGMVRPRNVMVRLALLALLGGIAVLGDLFLLRPTDPPGSIDPLQGLLPEGEQWAVQDPAHPSADGMTLTIDSPRPGAPVSCSPPLVEDWCAVEVQGTLTGPQLRLDPWTVQVFVERGAEGEASTLPTEMVLDGDVGRWVSEPFLLPRGVAERVILSVLAQRPRPSAARRSGDSNRVVGHTRRVELVLQADPHPAGTP